MCIRDRDYKYAHAYQGNFVQQQFLPDEVKDRVKNLSLYDAVLEVNHWCHEKVIYTPSDARTSSCLLYTSSGIKTSREVKVGDTITHIARPLSLIHISTAPHIRCCTG